MQNYDDVLDATKDAIKRRLAALDENIRLGEEASASRQRLLQELDRGDLFTGCLYILLPAKAKDVLADYMPEKWFCREILAEYLGDNE